MAPTLRSYQSAAVRFLMDHARALVHSPAGSGKTVIGAAAVREFLVHEPHSQVLWLCNTKDQQAQALRALGNLAHTTHVTVKCVAGASIGDLDFIDLLVMDECHHAPAATWWALADRAIQDAISIWGLTATPWHYRDEERNERLRELFQGHIFEVNREELLSANHLVPGRVKLHDPLPPHVRHDIMDEVSLRVRSIRGSREYYERRRREITYQVTREIIEANGVRNRHIADLASEAFTSGQITLVLVGSIQHGQDLKELINNPGADLLYAKRGARARRDVIEAFRAGDLPILLATSLADEGLDVPIASRVVLTMGGRSPQKVEQRVGRVLRPYEGKDSGEIHDYLDSSAPMAYAQALARVKVYRELGYSVDGLQTVATNPPIQPFDHAAFAAAFRRF